MLIEGYLSKRSSSNSKKDTWVMAIQIEHENETLHMKMGTSRWLQLLKGPMTCCRTIQKLFKPHIERTYLPYEPAYKGWFYSPRANVELYLSLKSNNKEAEKTLQDWLIQHYKTYCIWNYTHSSRTETIGVILSSSAKVVELHRSIRNALSIISKPSMSSQRTANWPISRLRSSR